LEGTEGRAIPPARETAMADKITIEQAGPDTRVITAYRPAEPDPEVTHAIDEACRAMEAGNGQGCDSRCPALRRWGRHAGNGGHRFARRA